MTADSVLAEDRTSSDFDDDFEPFDMENAPELLSEGARILVEVIEQAGVEERTDQGVVKERVRTELRRFFRRRSGRRPFVLPVIMEI